MVKHILGKAWSLGLAVLAGASAALAAPPEQRSEPVGAKECREPQNSSSAKRQARKGGYCVGKGGVARAAPESPESNAAEGVSSTAPIGINEPGINRAAPAVPIGVNEPGVNRARPPQ